MNKNAREKELLQEAYTSVYEAVGHYDTHVRLQRGGRWNAHTVNVRKTDKELIKKFLDQGFRIVKPGEEDEGEEDNEGMSNLEALISSNANEDGELKLDDETDAAEFEINKTQY